MFLNAMDKKLQEDGKTIQDLAKDLDVSERSIYNFRSEKKKRSKFLAAKIANALELKPKDYSIKSSFFVAGLICIGLGVMMNTTKAKASEIDVVTPTTFVKEVDHAKIDEEVFGVDYNTDFTPGYYEPIVDEDIPLTPEEQLAIMDIAKEHNVCYELVLAIMDKESGYNADAINYNGTCKGAMQINPSFHDCDNPYDLLENVEAGCTYLEKLFNDNEDVGLVLSLYHGESDAYEKYENGIISDYANEILSKSEALERAHGK